MSGATWAVPHDGAAAAVRTPEGRRPGLSAAAVRAGLEVLQAARADRDLLSDLGGGRTVAAFEEDFASYVGARYAVSASSGTAALVTALRACGVGAGDEVIVSPYGWGGTVAAVLGVGAVPVFADIEAGSFNLDPTCVESAVRPRTRVVLATHLFGEPADIRGLGRVASEHGLRTVYDAAQALGARYDGRTIGAFGDIIAFSLGRGKLLTAGEGGVAVTGDRGLYERMVALSQHPIRTLRETVDARLRSSPEEVSLSARIHPLAAALGQAGLQEVESLLSVRRAACLALCAALNGVPGIRVPTERPGTRHAFHRFALTYVEEELGGLPRGAFVRALAARNVPLVAGPVGTPIHRRAAVRSPAAEPKPARLPVTERRCAREELLIESPTQWLDVPGERIGEIAEAFREVVGRAGGSPWSADRDRRLQ